VGYIEERAFNDGGTKMITIVDAEGKAIDVYFDHRIGTKEKLGTIYLYDHPDNSGSVRLADQAGFRKKILRSIPLPDSFEQ
jgi:RimJ/RimL family protein N-acetyltransferase